MILCFLTAAGAFPLWIPEPVFSEATSFQFDLCAALGADQLGYGLDIMSREDLNVGLVFFRGPEGQLAVQTPICRDCYRNTILGLPRLGLDPAQWTSLRAGCNKDRVRIPVRSL